VPAHALPPVGPYGEVLPLSDLGKEAIGVETQVVERTAQPMRIAVPGKIEVIPTRQFDQHAPLSGRIAKVLVNPGEGVKAGEMLAVIDSPEMNQLAAQLLQGKVDTETEYARQQAASNEEVRQAQEKLRLADAAMKRVQKLFDAKIASQKEVLTAEADMALAQTRIKTATENREIVLKALKSKIQLVQQPLRQRLKMLGVSDERIDDMLRNQKTLTSVPVFSARAGVVINITASPGKNIDPSVSLFTIADLTKVWATADVYEDDMAQMKVGEPVMVKVHGIDGPPVEGVLTYIGNEVDPATRTLPVRAELDNPSLRLKPDMFAELLIQTSDSLPIIALPRDAIVQNNGHNMVFVTAAGGYQPVYVRLGRSFGEKAEITQGLNAGQAVVVRGAFQLGAELVKKQGGADLFAQPTEGERMEADDNAGKPSGTVNLNALTIIVIVVGAFLLGIAVSALFLARGRAGSAQIKGEGPGSKAETGYTAAGSTRLQTGESTKSAKDG
jgi:cobalt-zinc-cadmium efflux system membrane fusion protein